MGVEEGEHLVLGLDGEVHPADQVVEIVVPLARGFLQQGQRGAHDADAAPVDADTRLDEMHGGMLAAAVERGGVEPGLRVDVYEQVDAGMVQQPEQLAELPGLCVRQDQVCVSTGTHDAKIRNSTGCCSGSCRGLRW